MVKITRVYTRKGDAGQTRVNKKTCIAKDSPQVEVLGLLDELNSVIGWALVLLTNDSSNLLKSRLVKIQHTLFDLGAYLCSKTKRTEHVEFFSHEVASLETDIDQMNESLPNLASFILPGGNELSARLHIARTICRRAECKLVSLDLTKHEFLLPYINRLSDWLFVAARFVAKKQQSEEILWQPSI